MNKKIKKGIRLGLVVLLILISFNLVVHVIEKVKDRKQQEKFEDTNITNVEINNSFYKQKDNIDLILCVGLDSYENEISEGYTNNELADFITLLIVDKENKTTLPIHINRDTMCNIDILGIGGKLAGKTYEQLSFAHSYGDGDLRSLTNVKNAVSDLLHGIRINNYISLTMNSVPIITDEVGGVNVLVEDDFSSIDASLKMGEYLTLRGDQSLTFVRTRSGLEDSSNLARMKRQRVYLRALYESCKDKKGDDKFVYNLLSDIGDSYISNIDIYSLSDLGNTLIDYELLEAIPLEGEAIKGEKFMEYYVDEKTIDDICIKYLFDEVKEK